MDTGNPALAHTEGPQTGLRKVSLFVERAINCTYKLLSRAATLH